MSMLQIVNKMITPAENRESFFKRIAEFYPSLDPRYKDIERAYKAAKGAFREDKREDGVRYFEHLRAVALIVLYLRVTSHHLIIAALLHDIVEDHPEKWPIERVVDEFGIEVARIVQYCSKPPLTDCATKEEQDRIFHRCFIQGPREFFQIKLPDRLHNTITLNSCSLEKRRRKVAETWQFYMPYAEKHGILYYELKEALGQVQLT